MRPDIHLKSDPRSRPHQPSHNVHRAPEHVLRFLLARLLLGFFLAHCADYARVCTWSGQHGLNVQDSVGPAIRTWVLVALEGDSVREGGLAAQWDCVNVRECLCICLLLGCVGRCGSWGCVGDFVEHGEYFRGGHCCRWRREVLGIAFKVGAATARVGIDIVSSLGEG